MLQFLKGLTGSQIPQSLSIQDPLPIGGYKASGTALASAARTASGNSADLLAPFGTAGAFFLNISAASGTTPSLTVIIEAKDPVSGAYFTIGSFAAKTTTGSEAIWIGTAADVEFLTDTYRISWTITGTTPSFTFSIGYCILPS